MDNLTKEAKKYKGEVDNILKTTERSHSWSENSKNLYIEKRIGRLNKSDATDFVDATRVIGDTYKEARNKGFADKMKAKYPELNTSEERFPKIDFYNQAKTAGE